MSKRKMTAEYLKEMVEKSFANVDIGYGGKMCVLPFQSLVDTINLYEDKIAWQEVEFQQLKEDYESIVEENSLLKTEHKFMSDKLIELEVETNNQQAENAELQKQVDELKGELENLAWYKMWHNKFKKEIDDLTLELETYRPTKLHGNGQCKCSNCGCVNWTDWFSSYKGQTLCDKCLKEILSTEKQRAVKETAKEILQELYEYPHEYHERKILEIAKRKGVVVE